MTSLLRFSFFLDFTVDLTNLTTQSLNNLINLFDNLIIILKFWDFKLISLTFMKRKKWILIADPLTHLSCYWFPWIHFLATCRTSDHPFIRWFMSAYISCCNFTFYLREIGKIPENMLNTLTATHDRRKITTNRLTWCKLIWLAVLFSSTICVPFRCDNSNGCPHVRVCVFIISTRLVSVSVRSCDVRFSGLGNDWRLRQSANSISSYLPCVHVEFKSISV